MAKNVPRHAVRMTFLDRKNYGINSTVFPTSFLSFFLKMKLSVSPTNLSDVLFIGLNVMGNSLRLMMNQMDRHVSIVIVLLLYFEYSQLLAMSVSSKRPMSLTI